jgi:hypothetical protein
MKPTAAASGSTSTIDNSSSAPKAETSAGPWPKSAQLSSASLTALVATSISHLAMEAPANGVSQVPLDCPKAETVFFPNTHCRQITAGHKPPKLGLRHAEQHPELAERQEAFINNG